MSVCGGAGGRTAAAAEVGLAGGVEVDGAQTFFVQGTCMPTWGLFLVKMHLPATMGWFMQVSPPNSPELTEGCEGSVISEDD